MAASTRESRTAPPWQAEPVEAAISGTASSNSEPTQPATLTFSVLGNRLDWLHRACPRSMRARTSAITASARSAGQPQ